MEVWLLILLTLSTLILTILHLGKNRRLRPGPAAVPIIGNLLWLRRRPLQNIEPLLRELHAKYGPIVTLRIGSSRAIFISDRALTHKALVEHGATFSDRPAPHPSIQFLSSNQHNIISAGYGPLWRLLRRNLITEILHSNRVKLYGDGRRWVLHMLRDDFLSKSESRDGTVVAVETFQFAMFCLLALMCFGEKLDEKAIKEIEAAQRSILLYFVKLNAFSFFPTLSKYMFKKRLMTVMEMRRRQKELLAPLFRAREAHKLLNPEGKSEERFLYSYVDSLIDIKLPDEGGRGLTDDEMVSLCSEFLDAGTVTTSTALQWIIANLVRHQGVQKKLAEEIESVVGREADEVKEDELQRMPYLKAVIMEGLRRHPPGHLVHPHSVTQEIEIGGYVIPKKVWGDPMKFRPERFMVGGEGEGVDITGTREIKMMPFGVGRRICPGLGLAMLHLEYFVANLVRDFEWKSVEGVEVDMAEKAEFTVVMKKPLSACLLPRRREMR